MSLVVVLVLAVFAAGPALANHENITVDGDLTDLIDAINNNLNSITASDGSQTVIDPTLGGFIAMSDSGNVYSGKCEFVNGYDARNFYLFLDFQNPQGGIAESATLYAGWDVGWFNPATGGHGTIGDVDGDDVPNGFGGIGSNPVCALSDPDNFKIGPLESYRIIGDLDCNGAPDIIVVVKNDSIDITLASGIPIPAGVVKTVVSNGSYLELSITDFDKLFPNTDLCNATFIMSANAEQDGLGEDFGFMGSLAVQPAVSITKSPEKLTLVANQTNQTAEWELKIKNTGLCILSTVSVSDVLDAGMTFVSSNPGRDAGGDDQNSTWSFTDLAPGDSLSIMLTAEIPGVCTGPLYNNASVLGTYIPPVTCSLDPREATDAAIAEVNCPEVEVPCYITGPDSLCIGEALTLCGPDETGRNFRYRWTAPDLSVITTDDSCVTFDPPASGYYTLVVIDDDANLESDGCSHLFKEHKNPFCAIAGPPSACEGDHVQLCGPQGNFSYLWTLPDASTSTAQCLDFHPVTAANAGLYTLVVTDNRTGCSSDPCTATFEVNAKPVCSITPSVPNPVAEGSTVELCGPAGNYTYAWTLPNGTTESGQCVTINMVQQVDAGLYTLVLTDNTTECSSSCSYVLSLEGGMVPCTITGAGKFQAGTAAELCGPDGPYTYLWTLPDGSTATTRCLTFPSLTESDEGHYTLTVSAGGNSMTCSDKISVNGSPPACENCPRSADWWDDECEGKDKGHPNFSSETLEAIAECADLLSSFFNWGATMPATGDLLIARNSEWKYNDQGLDLGATNWRDPSYVDGTWPSGLGVLGYGENYVTTHLQYGPDAAHKYITTYFRKTFGVSDASSLVSLTLRVMYDDGFIAYLNGVEVARRSIIAGPVTYLTHAYSHEAYNLYEEIDLSSFLSALQDGNNVLAVELHQLDGESSDLIFDAELQAETGSGPPLAGSVWKYEDEGVDLGTSWRNLSYNDATWKSGPGVLGYGESYVTTQVSYGPSSSAKYATTYFRHRFLLNNAASATGMTLRLMYDDGACVFINGMEVARVNIAPGTVTYNTWSWGHEANDQYVDIDLSAYTNLLVDGANIIAVEVHQTDASSSDMIFDAELIIPGATAVDPVVTTESVAGNPTIADQFCAVLTAKTTNARTEAKAQFAALLANICASGQMPLKTGGEICLNTDTPIDCKYLGSTTIGDLIGEVDALLASLESLPLSDAKGQYDHIIDCLEEINNGWGIPVGKDCDDGDKKGRMTPAGDAVAVDLGPTTTVTFDHVDIEGITYIALSQGWVMPQGLMALDGNAIELSSTATFSGNVGVDVHYDETLLQSPEQELKLLRYNSGTREWTDVTTGIDAANNTISGLSDGLSPFVVAAPWTALSADEPAKALSFGIKSSFPNPTNGAATVRYALTKSGPVTLSVHDVQGRLVATLARGTFGAGEHTALWNGRTTDGRKLSAGIYVIRLESAEGLRTAKLVMMN